jgi:hypothetical protein
LNGKLMAAESTEKNNTHQRLDAWFAKIPATWLLVLPLLLLIPTMASFPYPSLGAAYSDLTISHYPNAIFFRESIANWGEIPLWSSTIMGGYPFAANPLSGLWYPPGWLALILPLPLGFNLLTGLHLVWGGIGLYKLLRAEGLGMPGALLAGLSFGLLPKMFAHYGAGHLTLLYAVPWTPWLLLCQRKYASNTGRRNIPPGLVLALIFLVDMRWSAFALLTWWAYALSHWQEGWWDLVKKLSVQTALALLIAAPQLLPLIEFSALSTRAELTAADVLERSLPIPSLLGLLLPNLGTIHEWVLYAGGTVLLLALGGVLLSPLKRNKSFWGILSLVTILVALGSQLPGSAWIAKLPLISMLRVPSRALFLTGLGIASLAGYGLDALSNNPGLKQVRIYGLTLFGVSVFSLLLVVGFRYLSGEYARGMLWGTLGVIIGAAWIGFGLKRKLPASVWVGGVFLLVVLDLAVFDLISFAGKSAALVLAEGVEAAGYIAKQGGDIRTYSPSYSLPQQTAVHHGLRMADGVDPLQIADYTNFMDQASGVPRDGYSVTIPPFANGEPRTDNATYLPDVDKLGLLNVGYVVSDFALQAEGLVLEKQLDGDYIYRNEAKRFPAWVQPGDSSGIDEIQPAEVVKRSANRLEVSATGPGMLIVAEIAYPGWSVFVDGVEKNLLIRDEVLMGVDLAPGTHQAKFVFRPRSVYIGLLLFCVGSVLLVWSARRENAHLTRG